MNATTKLVSYIILLSFAFIGCGYIFNYFGINFNSLLHYLSNYVAFTGIGFTLILFILMIDKEFLAISDLDWIRVGYVLNVSTITLTLIMYFLYSFYNFNTLQNDLSAAGFNLVTLLWCFSMIVNQYNIIKLIAKNDSK